MATSVSVSVSAVMAQRPTEITTIERERDVDVDVDVEGENNTKIFRYKLSNDILSIITQFAKIHQLDDRHSYKEAWEVWLNENKEKGIFAPKNWFKDKNMNTSDLYPLTWNVI